MMPHERARAIRVEVLNAPLDTIATLATVNIGALSRHERGASGALSPAAIERVEQILNDLIAVKKKRFRGVPLDMSNIPFLRKQLREMGLDRPPAKIDQSLGGAKVTAAKRMVHIAKLPHCDYVKQVDMIKATLSRFGNPRALVDETGTGTAVVEMMRAKGIEVEEFTFTNASKMKVVADLGVAFEQKKILLPKTGRTLEESRAIQDLEVELFNFEPTVLKSGNIRYEAAGSYNDDMIMALCLAHEQATRATRQPWSWVPDAPAAAPPQSPSFAQPSYDPFDCGPERIWHRLN